MIMQSDLFMNKFISLTLILPQFIITIGYNMVLGFGPMVLNISSNDIYLFGVQFWVLCSCLHNLCTTPRHPTFHQLPSKGGSKFNWKKKSTFPRIWCQRICLSVCLSTLNPIISPLLNYYVFPFTMNVMSCSFNVFYLIELTIN